MTRAEFIKALLLGGVMLFTSPHAHGRSKKHFSLLQIASAEDRLHMSYVMKTQDGSLVIVDGSQSCDVPKLRRIIRENGNRVKAWFITHPHFDHITALNEILKDPGDIVIDTIYHSKLPASLLKLEGSGASRLAYEFYGRLDGLTETRVVDIQKAGKRIDIDGIRFMILGVNNPEITKNTYNNSSMIIRAWDDDKSIVFLGDAGKEAGDKVLKNYRKYLDCDYLQMAHHGQYGCDEHFYKTISFRVCLWPSPKDVWNPKPDSGLTTMETRRWMDEKGIREHHVTSVEGDYFLA